MLNSFIIMFALWICLQRLGRKPCALAYASKDRINFLIYSCENPFYYVCNNVTKRTCDVKE